MFTWICPKCGTEVPPSYDDCPKCSGKLDELASKQPLAPVEPPTFGSVAPPPPKQPASSPAAPAPPGPEAPMYYRPPAPPPNRGMPPWLVTLLVAGGLIAVVGGGMYLYNQRKAAAAAAAAAAVTTPLPGRSESEPIKPHPYAKFIEITGVRITEEHEKPKAAVIVVNHSGAELPALDILVHLVAVTAKGESEPEATFTLKVPSLPAYSSKDMTVDMQTTKRAYELADWQFLKAEFQILTPAQ